MFTHMTTPRHLLRIQCPLTLWRGTDSDCHWCSQPITSSRRRAWCSDTCRRGWERNHIWGRARASAKKRDRYQCAHCGAGKSASLEVNHINPVNGAGYDEGCAHHQENLETLCHACHVGVTAVQRRAGLFTRQDHSEAVGELQEPGSGAGDRP
jgi:5-methylcytosine-specific restriction endonuclease McrA